MSQNTTIQIQSLRFFGYHGVLDEEQSLGRPFEADIEAIISEDAYRTDSIADTVNYVSLAKMLVDISDDRKFRTLEALLHEFAKKALIEFERIEWISICLRKPSPPTGLLVDSVGIQVVMDRSDLDE